MPATTTLQIEHDARRKVYMDTSGDDAKRSQAHQDFYAWLADAIRVTAYDLPVSVARIAASRDPHLNDIPLMLWDRKDPMIRHKAVQAGMRSWSLSDTVCTLKAFARREATKATA